MRYFTVPGQEAWEAEHLPARFGKRFAVRGPVTVPPGAVLDVNGVDLVDLDGETLAIQPDTACWAFLTPRERVGVETLRAPRTMAWLAERWPAAAPASAAEFVALLFRRGLLRIEGTAAVDPTILFDSSNTHEGHLVELLLTEKCNLACGYCLAGTHPDMPTMTPEIGRAAIDGAFAMHEAPSITFEFAGGEPFMQFPLMQELTAYARRHPERRGRKIFFAVQTNLTLLDDERVQWLRDEGFQVGVSIDGDPEQHDKSRPTLAGGSSFRKVIRGIDLLQKHGVPFGALVVLNRYNAGNAQDLIDFLVDNGISTVKLNSIAFLGTGRESWDEFGLTNDEVLAYFRAFAHAIVDQRHLLREANLATMCAYLVSKQRATRCLRTHCGAGESFQCVSADGGIYPCGRSSQTPEWRIGDVRTISGSLSRAGAANRYVQEIRERRPHDLEGCSSCHYRQLCQAGCSVQAFERYRTVRHRTPECSFYKTFYPYLMRWLAFDEAALDWLGHAQYFGGGAPRLERLQLFGDEAGAPPPPPRRAEPASVATL